MRDDKKSSIISEELIVRYLNCTKKAAKDPGRVREILQNAKARARLEENLPQSEYVQGLDLEEAATLLNIDLSQKELLEELFKAALEIKECIYGKRIVVFAPLYISNWCKESCLYCGFRAPNKESKRSLLSDEEIVEEVKALQRQGHKRLLMLTGDHPKYPFEKFLEALEIVSSVKTKPFGEIRRINVEIPALTEAQFKELKRSDKIGTYTLFQETYHRETYKKMHPWGQKSKYDWRLETMDRAQRNGIDDVGIGALFGLYDYRFEVLAMLMHAQHLDKSFGTGPHTVSIPRIQKAQGVSCSVAPPAPVDDASFKKIVAILRCAVPYTGMILSTRESPEMRRELYQLGISQISAGSKTEPGAYSQKKAAGMQFSLNDTRPVQEIIKELIELGYIPSWCTACYRLGRTGKKFMEIAKCGRIQDYCQPNALLTLSEYLNDYASAGTKEAGEKLIKEESQSIPTELRKKAFENKMDAIKEQKRDLFF